MRRSGPVADGRRVDGRVGGGLRAALEQMLERFGSNRLGDAPGEFPTYEHRITLRLTVSTYARSIPKLSEAPPALDSVEQRCWGSVGSSDG